MPGDFPPMPLPTPSGCGRLLCNEARRQDVEERTILGS
jgi:hypothetical protein